MANITDIERLNYYEGEFLGALDFQTEQEYHRDMRRRHNLGQHTWGIVSGLDIAQVPVPGSTSNAVDVYIQPGMAVDGFGREIVVLNKTQLTLDLFAAYINPGVLNVWISYAEVPLNPPTDPCTTANQPNAFGRVQEAFALSLPLPDGIEPTNDPVVVDNTRMAAPVQPSPPPPPVPAPVPGVIVLPYDNSVPYQEFSTDDSTAHWYVLLGQVSWDPTQTPPALVQIPDSQAAMGRQYVGSVASAIFTPGSSLVIQDRFAPNPLPKDLSDPTLKKFYGGVGVEVVGSLNVDRLLEAKQNILIDGAPDPANPKLSPLTINASSADRSFVQFRDSTGPLFSIWETPATPTTNPPVPAGLNFGETDSTGKPTTSDLFIQQGGNVGIGTQAPAVSLDVRGLASFQGVGIGTQTPVASLDVRGQGVFQGALSINNAAFSGVGSPGDARAAITFGATDTPAAFYLGTYDVNSTKATTILGVFSYQLNRWIQFWTPNGNVGIGTTTPLVGLDVANGGLLHVAGNNTFPITVPASQGAYLGWNGLTGGTGETDFINNQGLGTGGFAFFNTPNSGAPATTLMVITGAGTVGIGTTSPLATLHVEGTLKTSASIAGGETNTGWVLGRGAWGPDNWLRLTTTPVGSTYHDFAVNQFWAAGFQRFDLAEVTPANPADALKQGDVVVIDRACGMQVTRSTKPFDTSVYGVVSSYEQASMVIGGFGGPETVKGDNGKLPIALVGRAKAKVTRENGPIEVGDLLTTSSTPGHLMRCGSSRCVGSIVGKALESLNEAVGMITIRVSLS